MPRLTAHTHEAVSALLTPQALKGPIRDLKPTHLFINSGLHGSTNAWPVSWLGVRLRACMRTAALLPRHCGSTCWLGLGCSSPQIARKRKY